MSINFVQIAYKKCLELHDNVRIFFKIFWGRIPDPLPSPVLPKSVSALINSCTIHIGMKTGGPRENFVNCIPLI